MTCLIETRAGRMNLSGSLPSSRWANAHSLRFQRHFGCRLSGTSGLRYRSRLIARSFGMRLAAAQGRWVLAPCSRAVARSEKPDCESKPDPRTISGAKSLMKERVRVHPRPGSPNGAAPADRNGRQQPIARRRSYAGVLETTKVCSSRPAAQGPTSREPGRRAGSSRDEITWVPHGGRPLSNAAARGLAPISQTFCRQAEWCARSAMRSRASRNRSTETETSTCTVRNLRDAHSSVNRSTSRRSTDPGVGRTSDRSGP